MFVIFNCVYVCVSVWGYVHMSTAAHKGQRHQIPLELEFQLIVSLLMRVLGIELRSSKEQYVLLVAPVYNLKV